MASEEFLELTRSVWSFPAESARRVGHPAPVPGGAAAQVHTALHLRRRVVLDPFMGSGTTAVASVKTERVS